MQSGRERSRELAEPFDGVIPTLWNHDGGFEDDNDSEEDEDDDKRRRAKNIHK